MGDILHWGLMPTLNAYEEDVSKENMKQSLNATIRFFQKKIIRVGCLSSDVLTLILILLPFFTLQANGYRLAESAKLPIYLFFSI